MSLLYVARARPNPTVNVKSTKLDSAEGKFALEQCALEVQQLSLLHWNFYISAVVSTNVFFS